MGPISTIESIMNISPDVTYRLQAISYPGERVEYFVDNVIKGTLTDTNYLPILDLSPMEIYLRTTEAVAKTLWLYNWQVAVE